MHAGLHGVDKTAGHGVMTAAHWFMQVEPARKCLTLLLSLNTSTQHTEHAATHIRAAAVGNGPALHSFGLWQQF
jgi:hypothetical protein